MSYEKQTWETGQVITAEKLNHIEDGIANADGESSGSNVFIVNIDGTKTEQGNDQTMGTNGKSHFYCTFDKTGNEIDSAYNSGKIVRGILKIKEYDDYDDDYVISNIRLNYNGGSFERVQVDTARFDSSNPLVYTADIWFTMVSRPINTNVSTISSSRYRHRI